MFLSVVLIIGRKPFKKVIFVRTALTKMAVVTKHSKKHLKIFLSTNRSIQILSILDRNVSQGEALLKIVFFMF